MEIVSIDGLTVRFGDFTAVDRLDLHVDKGEIFGLLGPNGAGKTTTIKVLTTLLPPTEGDCSVAGFDVRKESRDVREVIGYVPQMLSTEATITGYENLLIFAKLYRIPKGELKGRVDDAIAFMDLQEAKDRLVRTYSGGMVRRLEIAQATLHRPRVMFMDEPTVGLDPNARRAVWKLITRLRDEYGATIFLTTHFMDEADALCDRVAIMHHGKLVALGSPKELKEAIGADNLDEVFIHYTGESIEATGGSFRDLQRERITAKRLG